MTEYFTRLAALYAELATTHQKIAALYANLDATTEPIDPPTEGNQTAIPNVQRRMGRWVSELRLAVLPIEMRTDRLNLQKGSTVYRLADLFTTRDGSWEPSDRRGSVDQWARDAYLKPYAAADYFDDAGGATHLFAAVIGLDGELLRNFQFTFWSDGIDKLNDPAYQGYQFASSKERSGWANHFLSNSSSYVPERKEWGPWCWCPAVGAADVVCGGGLPANEHISTFAVWRAVQVS